MTDIVDRLRADGALTGYYDAPAIQRKAADEIERLRAKLLRVVEHADMAPELYASDADVWRGMADIARAALAKEPGHD